MKQSLWGLVSMTRVNLILIFLGSVRMLLASDMSPSGSEVSPNETRLLQLESQSSDLTNLPSNLWEAARIHYQSEDWAAFFGVTYILRKKFPNSTPAQKARLLESLALLRHCQSAKALSTVSEAKFHAEKKSKSAVQFLGVLLNMGDHFSQAEATSVAAPKVTTVQRSFRFWPIRMIPVVKLNETLNPFHIRRVLRSICKPIVPEESE